MSGRIVADFTCSGCSRSTSVQQEECCGVPWLFYGFLAVLNESSRPVRRKFVLVSFFENDCLIFISCFSCAKTLSISLTISCSSLFLPWPRAARRLQLDCFVLHRCEVIPRGPVCLPNSTTFLLQCDYFAWRRFRYHLRETIDAFLCSVAGCT